jgi:hypothetical protein
MRAGKLERVPTAELVAVTLAALAIVAAILVLVAAVAAA